MNDVSNPKWGHVRQHPVYGAMVYHDSDYIMLDDFLKVEDPTNLKLVEGHMVYINPPLTYEEEESLRERSDLMHKPAEY